MSKAFLFQAIQFSQTVLIQTIYFSESIDFVYTQSNVKTVLYLYFVICLKQCTNYFIPFYCIELISRAIAKWNNNYLSLINFKVKLYRQRLSLFFFFFNKWTLCWRSKFFNVVNIVSRGVLEPHVGCLAEVLFQCQKQFHFNQFSLP